MRALYLCLLLLFVAGCAARIKRSAPVTASLSAKHEPLPEDRRAADALAQKHLMELHFFDEGRGMHLSPGYLRRYNAFAWTGLTNLLVRDRWGFSVSQGKAAGLHDVRYKDMSVGVAGCAACHSGKAAGRFYPGLGNKNFDVTQLGLDLAGSESRYAAMTSFTGEKREVEQSAIRFAKTVGDPDLGNVTQGMVPVSLIFGWFYRQSDGDGKPATRGAVKVPALWGYAAKRPAGLFCDGVGLGRRRDGRSRSNSLPARSLKPCVDTSPPSSRQRRVSRPFCRHRIPSTLISPWPVAARRSTRGTAASAMEAMPVTPTDCHGCSLRKCIRGTRLGPIRTGSTW